MLKAKKSIKVSTLVLLTAMLLIVAAAPGVKAQTNYTVTVFPTCSGSTTPSNYNATGAYAAYSYASGSTQTFTATPSSGFTFLCWIIGAASGATTSTSATLSETMTQSLGLQAVFIPTGVPTTLPTPPSTVSSASVALFIAYGGTTTPSAVNSTQPFNSYTYSTMTSTTWTATAGTGFTFLGWVIVVGTSGYISTSSTLTYTVAGSTAIQPIFVPTSSGVTLPGVSPAPTSTPAATPTPPVSHFSGYTVAVDVSIAVVFIVVVLIIVFLLMRSRRKKTA